MLSKSARIFSVVSNTVLAAAAEHERHMIGERTRHALAAAKARGVKLGNPEQAKINRAKAAERARALRPHIERCIKAGRTSSSAINRSQRARYCGTEWRPMVSDVGASCPGSSRPIGKLNLWRGWGVEPKPGDWSLMRKHIFEVLAARDEALDAYIMNWLAFLVQHPDVQAEAVLAFLGDEGTGRGTLGKALCRIFGPHSLHISSSDHLTGRFTGHLQQVSFLFVDEAYAADDRNAEGRFKRMVTDDTLTIEHKGRTPKEEPNRLHIMMASNHEWMLPAGAHARRFAVQKVADTHRQDPAWFGPIYKQMQNGGWEAMLFDLLNRDIGDWHPRQIVRTAALAEQQEQSLSALDAWWLELLQTGVLAGSDELAPERAISNKYEKKITERDVGGYGSYGSTRTRTVWRDGLFDQARRSSPKLKNATEAAMGRYLSNKKRGCCTRCWLRGERGWKFPPLAECRKRWKERFPDTVWDDEDILEWMPAEGNDAAPDDDTVTADSDFS